MRSFRWLQRAVFLSECFYTSFPLLAAFFFSGTAVHQAFTQASIHSSFNPSNPLTAYIYFYTSACVDFCVGRCLHTCLPVLDQCSFFFPAGLRLIFLLMSSCRGRTGTQSAVLISLASQNG